MNSRNFLPGTPKMHLFGFSLILYFLISMKIYAKSFT